MAGQPDYILGYLNDIDLRQLRIFATIVECGGITAAEPVLNMANSTLSTHLSKLEERLKVRLCRRGRAGFALTPQGERVYEAARRMFDSLEVFREAVHDARVSPPERISIRVPDSLLCSVMEELLPALRRFLEERPDVSLDIDLASPGEIDQGVVDGKVDLGINSSPRRTHNLRFYDLKEETNGLYCGVTHPLCSQVSPLTAEQVLEHELIRAHGYHYPKRILRVLRTATKSSCIPIDGRVMLLATGRYLAFMAEDYARPYVERGMLREIMPEEFRYKTQLAVMVRADAEDSAVLKFLEILEDELRGSSSIPRRRAAR